MLCPKCGADVGDKIRLCDNCESERQARLDAERKAKEEAEAAARRPKGRRHDEQADAVAFEAEDPTTRRPLPSEQEKPSKGRIIFLGLLTLLALVAVKVVKRAAQVKQAPPIAGAPGPELTLAPTSIVSRKKSGLRVNNTEVRPAAGIAVFHRKTHQLEIGFFRELIEPVNEEAIRTADTLEAVPGLAPDAILAITFTSDSHSCNMASVAEYHLTVFRRDESLGLPAERVTFPVRRVGDAAGRSASLALDSLTCGFTQGDKVTAAFRGSKQLQVRDETPKLSWELDFDGFLIGPSGQPGVSFRSSDSKTSLALWNPQTAELSVGFFADELSMSTREKIRRSGTFQDETNPRPDAVFAATLTDKTELSTNALKTYGMLFYRGRAGAVAFTGESDEAGLFFVPNATGGGTLEGFGGQLKERTYITGTFRNTIIKNIGGKDIPFDWDVRFNTFVMDVTASSDDFLLDDTVPKPEQAQEVKADKRTGSFGQVKADDAGVDIRSTVALYYPASGDLAVGFFPDELNASDVAEIRKKKSMSSAVNQKRAAMVILFDYETGVSSFSKESLLGYTVYFYRDPGTTFQFPGFHEAVSFRRSREQLDRNEVVNVSGTLAKLSLRLFGSGSGSQNPTKFSWDLKYELTPEVLK